MKKNWLKIAQKIDALSVRERIILVGAGAVVLVMLMTFLVIDPLFLEQKKLRMQAQQAREQMAALAIERQQVLQQQAFDPDAANRARLQVVSQQLQQMQGVLLDLQKGLVSPNRMAALLEDIIQRNGKLRLVSLHTLEPVNLITPKKDDTKLTAVNTLTATTPGAAVEKPVLPNTTAAIYKHGVELTLQGNYLDMMRYMSDLEAMPWQLYWGQAKLEASDERTPVSTLTLTLFTLSLDKKWLNL